MVNKTQRHQQFLTWFPEYRCDLLTSRLTGKKKRSLAENIQLGLSSIVIGTHALFQKTITFHDLGLIIIDEQHRFGVDQRLALQAKGHMAHQLIMTATPIPRTLAMRYYKNLDISTIHQLPWGRSPVKTLLINDERRAEVIKRVVHLCGQKQQVYWVCTAIFEQPLLAQKTAASVVAQLEKQLPGVGLVHGKLPPSDKEKVMASFCKGALNVLVATTVIEVGVNVPNATLIVIENPERLGLAQLHQLRGRVGRGEKQSYCILLYQSPLSDIARKRLNLIKTCHDGFEIAKADLNLRGPGEVLGLRQSGGMSFKVADWLRDQKLFNQIPDWFPLLETLAKPLQAEILDRWCAPKKVATVL